MALKFALVCALAVLLVQVSFAAKITKRETAAAPAEKTDVSKEINEALNFLKSNVDNLLKDIQDNKMVSDLTAKIQKFGEDLGAQGKQLVEKIQTDAKTR